MEIDPETIEARIMSLRDDANEMWGAELREADLRAYGTLDPIVVEQVNLLRARADELEGLLVEVGFHGPTSVERPVPDSVARAFGTDAMWCEGCTAWHHVRYHEERGAAAGPKYGPTNA